MPTTRRQAALLEHDVSALQENKDTRSTPAHKKQEAKPSNTVREAPATAGRKHEADQEDNNEGQRTDQEPPTKKPKTEESHDNKAKGETGKHADAGRQESERKLPKDVSEEDHPASHSYQTGTIDRGHVYFFYRPKVELEAAHSRDDVQRFYMLLVPRPPEFSTAAGQHAAGDSTDGDGGEMALVSEGADAVPAAEPTDQKHKNFRLIVLGKKGLPDPEKGRGRSNVFWGTIVTAGSDLRKLQDGLGPRQYETKTRGTRHQSAARLAARGAYAIVNRDARTPSQRETHFGYRLSHPASAHFGEVQAELGLCPASSFVMQVKNPLAPPTGPGRVRLAKSRTVDYPDRIMHEVFGKGGRRGKENFGLRFASAERREMLEYEGVELLFIAARSGDEGLEESLGEGRGTALCEAEEREGHEAVQQIFEELAMDMDKIPSDPLEGIWA
ncbi:uncharacterized protein FIBRA_05776 [Fibroporia radiculosa]|uniref:Uncharacterized protein n=1 Tax=Fibroporia radiculosa TaxID=599839 RepID=J4HY31_9APHY|nr:uncharacterized protein FIBRA_05776 [Fibroporia radiculosa]CCM03632.1 predicted protein [Fibroporia radiculosa]